MHWLHKLLDKLFRVRGEQEGGDVVKPFLDHLEDLRWSLIKMAITLVCGMILAFVFVDDLTAIILAPLQALPGDMRLLNTRVVGPFMISLQIAFYAGLVLTFPLQLYFIAEFVLPALTRRERTLLIPGLLGGFVLFGVGVVLAYRYILPLTLRWFYDYALRMHMDPRWNEDYYSFVTHLTIATGLLAELPVIVLALALLGLVSFHLLSTTRKYAYVAIMILVAIISPTPDPITFIVMAAPVLAIYEGCIWIVWGLERRRLRPGS